MALLKDRFGGKNLAELSGIHRTQLYKYIGGDQLPGTDALIALIDATECDPAWLLTGAGEPFPTVHPEDLEARADVRAAWLSVCAALAENAEALQALAPHIAPRDAGDPEELAGLVELLAAAIGHLGELRRAQNLELEQRSRTKKPRGGRR